MTKDNLVTAPVGTTLEQAQKILAERRIESCRSLRQRAISKDLSQSKDIEKGYQSIQAAQRTAADFGRRGR